MRRGFFPLACVSALLVSGLLAAVGCSDTDPTYGPPGAIKNYDPIVGSGSSTSSGGEAGAVKTAAAAWTDVYAMLKTAGCPGCHAPPGASGAPVFLGADEASSRDSVKAKGYQTPEAAGNMKGLATRGAHSGRALKPEEIALITAWRNAEAKEGGGTAPTDAGGGG